jgi:hypothetical protein
MAKPDMPQLLSRWQSRLRNSRIGGDRGHAATVPLVLEEDVSKC